jgi:hypothetical protein
MTSNKIEEIEKLRDAVIKKHFQNYGMMSSLWAYQNNYDLLCKVDAEIDRKVIYYVKLGITANEL